MLPVFGIKLRDPIDPGGPEASVVLQKLTLQKHRDGIERMPNRKSCRKPIGN